MPTQLRVLTVRQPWAWAIIHGGKDVENRSRPTTYRGPLFIHAGMKLEEDNLSDLPPSRPVPSRDEFVHGAIIGVVDVVDCVKGFDSAWAVAALWQWVLRRPRALRPPVSATGKLGLWKPPTGLRPLR